MSLLAVNLLASTPLLVAGAAASFALLVWVWRLERARPRSRWRRGALVAMVGSLFLLVARPALVRSAAAGTAVLVTAGSDRTAVASLDPTAARFALPGAATELGDPTADLGVVARRHPGLRRWLVSGRGLDSWQLAALPGEVVFALPVVPRPGIERAQWRRRVALGEPLAVQGSVLLGANEAATLSLVGPAGVEASQDLVGSSTFRFNAVPRQVGRFLYRLELAGAAGSLASEAVDIEVTAPRLPRLLWLEGAPGFESREVKAWLRDLGGALVLRTQISRGRFRYEQLNQEQLNQEQHKQEQHKQQWLEVARLDSAVLAGFDLLVIDGLAWSGLAPSERSALDDAVESGLGLVLVPPLPQLRLPQLEGAAAPPGAFAIEPVADLDDFEVEIEAEGPGESRLAPLVNPARQFSPRPGQRTLMTDAAGRALAVSTTLGIGRVAATLLEATYRWSLRGETASHRRYWSRLLAAVARPSTMASASLPAGPILVDRPLVVDLVAATAEPGRIVDPAGDGIDIAWGQHPLEPRRWQATLWPRVAGWHRLAWGESSLAFYVASASDWASWREREAYTATTLRAALGSAEGAASEVEPVPTPLPRWPLFALLLALWALLWADEQWRTAPVGE